MDSYLDYFVSQFSSVINGRSKGDRQRVNNLLDELNALDYKAQAIINKNKAALLINQCFSLVSPSDTFLVAKCCHLVINLIGKQGLRIEQQTLRISVSWCIEALKLSGDIALLDILQALEVIIIADPTELKEMCCELFVALSGPLEEKASVSAPFEVKICKTRCLKGLIPILPDNLYNKFMSTLMSVVESKCVSDPLPHAQVVRIVLESVQLLCETAPDWLCDNLGNVLGVVSSYVHYGLPNWVLTKPTRLFPTPGSQWEPQPPPVPRNQGKRRHKTRKAGVKLDEEEIQEKNTTTAAYANIAPIIWATSDSDVSDSEGGRTARLKQTQAKCRLTVINTLLNIVKVIEIRNLFGYYSSLFSSRCIVYNVLHDPNPRVVTSALSAISVLLSVAKGYLAQAQYSENCSFTPFSGVLASLLETLHQSLETAVSISPVPMSVLHCAAILVDVTPYHRVKPGILSPLMSAALPFLRSKESNICVAALTFLGAVVAAEPKNEDIASLLTSPNFPCDLGIDNASEQCWVLAACLHDLNEACLVPVRVEWLQVLGNLIRFHPDLVLDNVSQIFEVLLTDLKHSSEFVQLHAARAFQSLTTAMTSTEDILPLWSDVLHGPLPNLLHTSSPSLSAAVCDCLANMHESVFSKLPNKLQILCMTLLFGCSQNEESLVRASAVQALAVFLTFHPLLEDEQFVYDCSEVFMNLVSDISPQVSVKAAWALGNLTDIFLKHHQFTDEIVPPLQLLQASFVAAEGSVKVRCNGVRALGNVMALLTQEHLNKPEYKQMPVKAAQTLAHSATRISNMKVKWNACYAIGNMLKNEALHSASDSWQGLVLSALCNLVVRCTNFKVRANATTAISYVSKREYFGSQYIIAWTSLSDGLDNAANMTDFKEFKHQDNLIEQLCMSLCHLVMLLTIEDLANLHDILMFRIDILKHHMSHFQADAVPERTSIILDAAKHISELSLREGISSTQQIAINILSDIFVL